MAGIKTVKISGISMYPTLRPGEVVPYKTCTFKDIARNDIFLFERNQKIVCHRLIFKFSFRKSCFLLEKGDNPFFLLSFARPTRVVGKLLYQPAKPFWLTLVTMPGFFIGLLFFTLKKKVFRRNT